jgi:hypothetical protein
MHENDQLYELEGEVVEALRLTLTQANRRAVITYVDASRGLRWSNAAIERLVGLDDGQLEEELSLAVPAVCADMKSWAASGYRTLSTATRELNARREEANRRQDMQVRATESLRRLLAPYEGPTARALLAKISGIGREWTRALGLGGTYKRLKGDLE